MNYGMPYKFVASGGSQSFEEAPWPVIECRRRLNWAQKMFLNEQSEYMDFNEQLIFAYLEGQKIEYHDDGESGLGPRIATFSLGGRAKMHMRMKAKHFVGCSKTGIFTEERPVPGSIDGERMYEKRLEKWEELQRIKKDTAAYNKRRKEIPKELGIFDKKTKKAQDLVTVTLSHGDIIIMDGYDIQKYLEHKVVPEGYLRFALTCRTVLPDHLKPEELPSYRVGEDPITYYGPKLSQMSGDKSAMELTPDN
jgi:alkylated DNA repair dioxygenase AlkB